MTDYTLTHGSHATREDGMCLMEAAAMRADRDAILAALGAPEGVDAIEYAKMCRELVEAVERAEDHGYRIDDMDTAIAWGALDEARNPEPPRPMPDGPGWWWGQYDCDAAPRPYYVTRTDCGYLDLLDQHCPYGAGSVSAGNANWTWLAGPDGRAVRCTPPETAP